MTKKIIAFFGEANSGKDTLAKILVKDYDFERMAFADELKKILSLTYSIPIRYFHERKLKDIPFDVPIFHNEFHHRVLSNFYENYAIPTKFPDFKEYKLCSPRDMMQIVGTEIFRHEDNNFWGKVLDKQMEDADRVVISDGRFKNEREWLKSKNAQLIRIKRSVDENSKHISENDFGNDSEYDIIIHNTGTLVAFTGDFKLWFTYVGRKR